MANTHKSQRYACVFAEFFNKFCDLVNPSKPFAFCMFSNRKIAVTTTITNNNNNPKKSSLKTKNL